MPLSFLTRLRGALVAATFALGLLCLDVARQPWIAPMIFALMPFLLWMTVSNAVKDAPPFDDAAFHRTRPCTSGRVFLHLAGFHLLLLAGVLVSLAVYGCYANVGVREMAIGSAYVTVPWIALVSLFATVTSLVTSTVRWKGWGPLTGLVIPALSMVAMTVIAFRVPGARWLSAPSATGMAVAGALLYPCLWWLVAARRAWGLGCGLAMLVGALLPWASHPLAIGDSWFAGTQPRDITADLQIRRLKTPAEADGMAADQASDSRLIEVKGLARDEFIAGLSLTRGDVRSMPGARGQSPFDHRLSAINGAAFSTDEAGRLIPAPASLLRAMGENEEFSGFPVWESHRVHPGGGDWTITRSLWLPTRSGREQAPSPEAMRAAWEFRGEHYRWTKVLETSAARGGRARLPGGGIVELVPPEGYPHDFEIVLRITRGRHSQPIRVLPALVARTADGRTGMIELIASDSPDRTGFLTRGTSLAFEQEVSHPQTLAELRDATLVVYWPEQVGRFSATLAPPE